MTSSSSHASATSIDNADADLMEAANVRIEEEQLLEAARLLRRVQDPSLLSNHHHQLLRNAIVMEATVHDLLSEPSSPHDGDGDDEDDKDDEKGHEWTKQGESHGKHDFVIYYKINGTARLTCRIESPIPTRLLVPLLSVLNESDLYHTWIPSWQRPFRMGVASSKQLLHDTRGHQVIQVQCHVPWPLRPREALFDVQAVDDIDARGFVLAQMRSLRTKTINEHHENEHQQDDDHLSDMGNHFELPPLPQGTQPADFDGAVLFRACPTDHVCYDSTRAKYRRHADNDDNGRDDDDDDDDLMLVQFKMFFDAHMTMVPQSLINFVTRHAIGVIWSMLLNVAEQVRDGTRRDHCEVIAKKADFYQWVGRRVATLLEMNKNSKKKKNAHDVSTKTSACPKEEEQNGDPKKPTVHGATANETILQEESWTLQEVLQMSI